MSSIVQGTYIRETGLYLHASVLSFFSNRGQMFAREHSIVILSVSIDGWKR